MKTFTAVIMLAFLLAMGALSQINMPRRDVCARPDSIIYQCKANPDCTLNARELQLWQEHENMLNEICPREMSE